MESPLCARYLQCPAITKVRESIHDLKGLALALCWMDTSSLFRSFLSKMTLLHYCIFILFLVYRHSCEKEEGIRISLWAKNNVQGRIWSLHLNQRMLRGFRIHSGLGGDAGWHADEDPGQATCVPREEPRPHPGGRPRILKKTQPQGNSEPGKMRELCIRSHGSCRKRGPPQNPCKSSVSHRSHLRQKKHDSCCVSVSFYNLISYNFL